MMIEKEVLELAVKKVMDKFAKENDSSKGWRKEDIENEILSLGVTMTDVYEARIKSKSHYIVKTFFERHLYKDVFLLWY